MGNPSLTIPDDLLGDVDAIAHDRSAPGNRTSRSEVVREALREYVDEHQEEVSQGKAGSDDQVGNATATN